MKTTIQTATIIKALFLITASMLFTFASFAQNDSISTATAKNRIPQDLKSEQKDSLRNISVATAIDTLSVEPKHSPARAALFSALLPGLGQAYNRKYWKIPIIYAGGAAIAYMINDNHKAYKAFEEPYSKIKSGEFPADTAVVVLGRLRKVSTLKEGKDLFRRNQDFWIIAGGVLYLLNIIDANVDAHFYKYDISEDLSLIVEPAFFDRISQQNQIGMRLCFKL